MKLNEKALAMASGVSGAIVAVICAVLVWMFPVGMTNIASFWAHMDFSNMARSVTLANFLGGIILTFVFGYIVGWIFAKLYNKFLGKTAA